MKSYKFKINNSDFTVDITGAEDNIIELEVNGTPFKVEMEKAVKAAPKTPKVVNAPVAQNAKTQPVSSSAVSKVEAPLPGVILSVNIKEGDTVKSGDTLMVMEAINGSLDDIERHLNRAYMETWRYIQVRIGYWKEKIYQARSRQEIIDGAFGRWRGAGRLDY